MTPEKHRWVKPAKKVEAEPPLSSWQPPWKTCDQVTNYVIKNEGNEDFLRKSAKHFGVKYTSDFEVLSKAIFDKAQYRL